MSNDNHSGRETTRTLQVSEDELRIIEYAVGSVRYGEDGEVNATEQLARDRLHKRLKEIRREKADAQ